MDRLKSQTFTLTFSESDENHAGMQIIGEKAKEGFNENFLRDLANEFGGEIIELSNGDKPDACVIIFHNGLYNLFGINPDDLYLEQDALEKDKKAFMYGRVVNKNARHNLCFADFDQDSQFEEGKGTVVNFNKLPLLNELRESFHVLFGDQFAQLFAEGNYYYDVNKTFIGWHGDTERSKVIGVRLCADFPIHYRWYTAGSPSGEIITRILKHGDIYIMSGKASGNDWKKRSLKWTLRHSAGDLKNIKNS